MNDKRPNEAIDSGNSGINVKAPQDPPKQSVPVAPDVKQALDERSREFELEKKRERHLVDLDRLRLLIDLRKEYARKLFYLAVGWLIVTLALVAFSAGCLLPLSDTVLVALITTTTINVLSLPLYAVRYIFQIDRDSTAEPPQR